MHESPRDAAPDDINRSTFISAPRAEKLFGVSRRILERRALFGHVRFRAEFGRLTFFAADVERLAASLRETADGVRSARAGGRGPRHSAA